MRGRLFSSLRPTPAMIVALLALVFAMSTNAGAGPKVLVTLTGGPLTTPALNSDEQVGNNETVIPLNGQAIYTITQKAGEALLIAAEASIVESPNTNFCGATVKVRGVGDENAPNSAGWLGLWMTAHSNKGEVGELADDNAIPAPAADRQIKIEAVLTEGQRNDPGLATLYGPGDTCDGFGLVNEDPENPDYPDPYQDTWTASVRVTVVSFRT